jgi:hypothetical protein
MQWLECSRNLVLDPLESTSESGTVEFNGEKTWYCGLMQTLEKGPNNPTQE